MFLSEGTVRNYLSSILSKLDLRDRTQLAIWAVQTGQIAKDLIMIKKVIISFIAIVFIYVAVTNLYTNKVVIHLGIFVGNWELPNGNDYKVIDDAIARFEKLHPNVEIEYESGILKSDYSLWLANKIVMVKNLMYL